MNMKRILGLQSIEVAEDQLLDVKALNDYAEVYRLKYVEAEKERKIAKRELAKERDVLARYLLGLELELRTKAVEEAYKTYLEVKRSAELSTKGYIKRIKGKSSRVA